MPRDVSEESREERRNERVGEWLGKVGGGRAVGKLEGGCVVGMRVRLPTEEDPMTLLIVRALSPGGKFIAFIGAPTLADAVLAWRARCASGRMKWRADVPWEDRH